MKKKRDSKLWINKVIRGGGGGAATPSRFSPSSGAATGISVCAPGQGPAGQAGVWLLRNSSGSHIRGSTLSDSVTPPPCSSSSWASTVVPLTSSTQHVAKGTWGRFPGKVMEALAASLFPAVPLSLPSSSASRLFQQTKAPRGQGPRGRALRVPFIWISFQNRGLPSDSSGGTEFCRKQTWT